MKMETAVIVIDELMASLARRRPVFCSEADFQHELAYEIRMSDPGLSVRLEWPLTHSLRRTKVALIYKKTGNLRACQLLLGHGKLESTVRYLGIEVDDALEISEQIDL